MNVSCNWVALLQHVSVQFMCSEQAFSVAGADVAQFIALGV